MIPLLILPIVVGRRFACRVAHSPPLEGTPKFVLYNGLRAPSTMRACAFV
jgi:hypothetical protein